MCAAIYFGHFFYRIYFGESNTFNDDCDNRSNNPRLLEYEHSKKQSIVLICDVFLDDSKVCLINLKCCTRINVLLIINKMYTMIIF